MHLPRLTALLAALPLLGALAQPTLPSKDAIDAEAARLMAATQTQGLAVAVVDDGQVVHVAAYGKRNAAGEPLLTDTVMYGASLTKAVFGFAVMQQVEFGRLQLEQATVAEATRIDQIARVRLGMKSPEAADIVVVRP